MALVKFPRCGKEISDQAEKCPNCGLVVKRQKSKKMIIVLVSILLVTLIGWGTYWGYTNVIIPMNHYKKAESYLSTDKYEKAIKEFSKAGKYKDSVEKIKQTKYKWASSADIDKAIQLYKELDDYKDSKDKLIESQKEKDKQIALEKLKSVCSKCSSSGTTMASDEKSIIVDSTDQYDYLSLLDIQTIINELELPSSLYDEMCYTNALMGRQVETYEYYEVSWSYHPDNGLDAIFKYRE